MKTGIKVITMGILFALILNFNLVNASSNNGNRNLKIKPLYVVHQSIEYKKVKIYSSRKDIPYKIYQSITHTNGHRYSGYLYQDFTREFNDSYNNQKYEVTYTGTLSLD